MEKTGSTPGLRTSNIHDLGKWGPILGTGRLISPAHFQEQIAPTSVGKGQNKPDLYFAYGFVISNGWIVQNPSINGYSGAFGHNLSNGVTIVVKARDRHHRRVRLRHSPRGHQVRDPGHASQLLAQDSDHRDLAYWPHLTETSV